jgi:exodeoxyribonuclease VII large subunit
LLAALSYRSVLTRGFALVRDEAGHPVHAAASIGPGAHLSIEFADGRVGAIADADRAPATRAAKPAAAEPKEQTKTVATKRVAKPVDQGSLF